MPDNRKIKRIRRLPDGNNIILIWVFLLLKAAESNRKGGLFFLEDMPYTVEDLADEFDFSVDLITFALKTLEKLSMIEIYDEVIYIKNWEKYQSVDKLEKIREQTRQRVARHREKKRLSEPKKEGNATVTLHVTQSNATDIDIDKDIDKENNYSSKIKDLLIFFSSINNFTKLNKDYWDVIRETRKTGQVAESVIYNNMNKWKKYDPVVVEYALKEHIENHKGKREEYTLGIMRNTTKEEVKLKKTTNTVDFEQLKKQFEGE